MHKFARFLIGLICLFSFTLARAQSDFTAALSVPQAVGFPTMVAYLDVRSPGGTFLSGLKTGQISLQEDGHAVTSVALQEAQRPVTFLVAVNPGPTLALRDSNGLSRYDQIVQTLDGWAEAAPPVLAGSFGLVANNAADQVGLANAAAWKTAFDAYKPDLRNAKPSNDALGRALDIASSTPSAPKPSGAGNPPAEKVVLYITPAPENNELAALPDLLQRAKQGGVHVLVWMVSSPSLFASPAAQQLGQLAQETGGQFAPFSGVEGLPDLEAYLAPLHKIYVLQYATALQSGTSHTLSAQIQIDQSTTVSAGPVSYSLTVLPPNPMLVSPPAQVTRTSPKDSQDPVGDLTPLSVPLQVLVEFPDGLARPLSSVRLYVDGQLASEKKVSSNSGGSASGAASTSGAGAPLASFDWDLSRYTTSGRHTLRVEAVDSLGLSKSSLETPVDVQVILPQVSLWERLVRANVPAGAGAVVLAGASLALIVVLTNRRRAQLKGQAAARRAEVNSPTAPMAAHPDTRTSWPDKLHWPRHTTQAPADASLMRLDANLQPLTGAPLFVQGREVTLGRDPTLATCLIDDPSVEGLHARLRQEPDGCYLVSDQGSIAGTWINLVPVSREGARLEHGDILHIGRCAFRFLLARPTHLRKPLVQPYNENL